MGADNIALTIRLPLCKSPINPGGSLLKCSQIVSIAPLLKIPNENTVGVTTNPIPNGSAFVCIIIARM